nr:VWA domain-containing protein [Moraxella lacunata]
MLLVTPMARGVGYTPVQNTERYATHTPNPVQSVAQNPISTFGADVDTGSYANTRRLLNDGRLPPAGAVRSEEFINYFDYDYPKPSDKEPFAVHTALTDSPFKDGAKILRIGIQGKETSTQAMPPANLVFLVDVSGSMHSNDKLPLVKQTLTLLTHQLRDVDSVSIITYADGEKLILPATYATEQGKRQLLDAIDKMKAGGATAGEQAIQMAYLEAQKHHKTDGINRILLMTDGDFNVGITDFDTLKDMVAQKRKSGVSLSTFGFGTGNYNEHLMEQLADAGDGNYSYIDSTNEAKKVLHRQLSSTLTTIAQDVKIQVEFNPATVKEYRLIGYENRVLDEADFNNDNVDSGDIGAGHAVTALYEIIPVGVAGYLADKRYSSNPSPTAHASEYAQLAIRYKLPNQAQSIKQTQSITPAMYHAKADDNTRLALAVATFAELLKGGQYTGNLTYDDVQAMLADVGGADKHELRAELRELIKTAKELSTPQKP